MTEKVTSEKEKAILKPEDFEKEIKGRRKKIKTHVPNLNVTLSFLLEIDAEFDLIARLFKSLEMYINVLPDIKKITRILNFIAEQEEERAYFSSFARQDHSYVVNGLNKVQTKMEKLNDDFEEYLLEVRNIPIDDENYPLNRDDYLVHSYIWEFREIFLFSQMIVNRFSEKRKIMLVDKNTNKPIPINKSKIKTLLLKDLKTIVYSQNKIYKILCKNGGLNEK